MLMKDLGRQTLIHGNKVPVEEMCAKIDSLTLEVRHHSITL
jgi:processing peptidase subunit alpha